MSGRRGFTLVEVVVTLVLISIAAAMLVPYMGRALQGSAGAAALTRSSAELSAQLAQILTDPPRSAADVSALNAQSGVTAVFVRFPASPPFVEQSGGTNLLKVTVVNARNQRLTTYLEYDEGP
jgi:prepilin-type N-terminal cleavage/methylation domain-containing protein